MRIKKILIELKVQEKIFKKHNVLREDIENVFLNNEPIFLKAKDGRYIAIGFIGEYFTIIFELNECIANIVTAYKSSKWQKKLYSVRIL